MTIRTAVITAAGLGTRLLPFSKELPKEMVPIPVRSGMSVYLKPIIQVVFENLYDAGFREFCVVVGRGKRAIEDHFTPDRWFLRYLKKKGKDVFVKELENFYSQIESSSIMWVNQAEPRGFGHAVLQVRNYIGNSDFIIHAGDTWIRSKRNYINYMLNAFHTSETAGVLLLKKVKDPSAYGVAEIRSSAGSVIVERVIEKPKKPRSTLAIMPVYCFSSDILDVLRHTETDRRGELQLTDGIQGLIEDGKNVIALKMVEGTNIDVGSPRTYIESLRRLVLLKRLMLSGC